MQHGDKFELRINNQSFTHLWDNGKPLLKEIECLNDLGLERTKRNFNYDNRDEINPYQQKDYAKNYE